MFHKLKGLGFLESTLVIITADHGGHDSGHTTGDPFDVTIPWILVGPGVRANQSLDQAEIRTMDTAATTLWALGIPLPVDLAGRPINQAFQIPAPAP